VVVDAEPGEQVFFHGHPSWRGILSFYFRGLLLAILAGVIAGVVTAIAGSSVNIPIVAAAVVVVFAFVLVAGFIKRFFTKYTITNRRLTIETGILSKEMHQTRLERVQNVNTTQTVMDRILRVGRVDFDTAAESGFNFAFIAVASPHQIVKVVDQAIHEFGHTQTQPPGLQPQSDV
jgi:uncharacterized membrane protein YdbT with pleckstrin-like domain